MVAQPPLRHPSRQGGRMQDHSPEPFQMALALGQKTPILSLLEACANSGPRNEPSALGWVIIN